MKRARIVLADDHADFMAVVARVLESQFDVVKMVGDGQALIDAVLSLDPDVAVLDICMPILNGIVVAQRLHEAGTRAKLIVLSVHGDPDYVRAAQAAGACGYVVKHRLASDLLPALADVLGGRSFVSPSISTESS